MPKQGSQQRKTERKTSVSRRSFLNAGLASAAVPFSALKGKAHTVGSPLSQVSSKQEIFPSVPSLQDLASDRLVHHFRDRFNPPLAQNEWGILQAVKSISAVTRISFPPLLAVAFPKCHCVLKA
jgi:hypothetical protein